MENPQARPLPWSGGRTRETVSGEDWGMGAVNSSGHLPRTHPRVAGGASMRRETPTRMTVSRREDGRMPTQLYLHALRSGARTWKGEQDMTLLPETEHSGEYSGSGGWLKSVLSHVLIPWAWLEVLVLVYLSSPPIRTRIEARTMWARLWLERIWKVRRIQAGTAQMMAISMVTWIGSPKSGMSDL